MSAARRIFPTLLGGHRDVVINRDRIHAVHDGSEFIEIEIDDACKAAAVAEANPSRWTAATPGLCECGLRLVEYQAFREDGVVTSIEQCAMPCGLALHWRSP